VVGMWRERVELGVGEVSRKRVLTLANGAGIGGLAPILHSLELILDPECCQTSTEGWPGGARNLTSGRVGCMRFGTFLGAALAKSAPAKHPTSLAPKSMTFSRRKGRHPLCSWVKSNLSRWLAINHGIPRTD
jgi:hypothetical protein